MTPVAGRLSDMYGKKKMLLLIVGIYTIGISTAEVSINFTVMIIARIMQGIGASMFPTAFGIMFPSSQGIPWSLMEARQCDDRVTMIFFFVNFIFLYRRTSNIQNHRYCMIEQHN